MAGWDEILEEIMQTKNQADYVRQKYLKALFDYTGRSVISYYSSWLTKQNQPNTDINDSDMVGFMSAVKGLPCDNGLDLILHTPGGSPEAAEGIINYLRNKFKNDIRIIVPQLAMSAGTMIACAGKEIIMGKHSNLGPIDPQFNGIPAYNIKSEFYDAVNDLKDHPENAVYWNIKLQKYPAAFLKTAMDAIDLSSTLLIEWLGTCMFDKNNDKEIIENIVGILNEHSESKNHGRHYDINFCKNAGLKITPLEDDNKLQDAVLSIHHAYMHTLSISSAVKIIENHNGKAIVNLVDVKNQ